MGVRWDLGGSQVGLRWESGRSYVGLEWDLGGSHVGVRSVSYTHLTLPTIYSV